MKQIYLLPILLFYNSIYCQYNTTGFDSIVLKSLNGDTVHMPLTKKQKMEALMNTTYEKDGSYYHNYALRNEQGTLYFANKTGGWPVLQLNKEKKETFSSEKFAAGGDIGRGVLTVFLPRFLSVASEKEILFRYNAFLRDSSDLLTLHCYFKGTTVRETSMGTNSAGSKVPQNITTSYLEFGRGAAGYLIQGADTLSEWYAVTEPKIDSGMSALAAPVFSKRPDKQKHKLGIYVYNQAVYGVKGNWKGTPFTILFNDMDNRAWMFSGENLLAVYQYPGRPLRSAENMLNMPEDEEPFLTYLLVSPSVTTLSQKRNLMLQVALAAWLVDVMSRPS